MFLVRMAEKKFSFHNTQWNFSARKVSRFKVNNFLLHKQNLNLKPRT